MPIECPECRSPNVRKAGIHYAREKKQKWQCKDCGRIFLKTLDVRSLFAQKGGSNDKK